MKRIIIILQIIILVACTNSYNDFDDFRIYEFYYGHGSNEDFSEQFVKYSITVYYKEGMVFDTNSIEPVLGAWIQGRMINHEISNINENQNENFINIEGKVHYDSDGLTKESIDRKDSYEKSILGIVFQLDDGHKYKVTGFGESTIVEELIK
ncbi:hypothetical protein V1503_20460 [Bacillus sp. SCS-151]|uniref:hypothetical protein n=1 Tax=Nanhaiella sioensis TaxID=3115293 RepID=UPI00397B90BF